MVPGIVRSFPKLSTLLIPIFLLFIACEKDEELQSSDGPGASGEKASFFLQPKPYSAMSFHILYQEGYKPKERARDSLKAFLEAYLRKPDGIGIRLKKIPDSGQTDYSTKDLNELIDENRPFPRIGTDRIHAFMVVVNGSYSEDGGGATTLGLAFAANRMALFGGAVEEYSDDPTEPQPWKLEASVMSHEMGHNLGLVANGSPMVNEHRDEDHGSHCDNSDCLMYYTAETSDIVNSLVGNKVPTLDAACQNDLEANGGS